MNKVFRTLTMTMCCIVMALFVSCKKENAVPSGGGDTPIPTTHEYVDLGLPSGLLWATCNVGADSPEDYGDYFAWGETTPKDNYDLSTYKWSNDDCTILSKYNTKSLYGTVDNKTVLELEDDAAHVNWGGDWRMPTYDELVELKENCTWTWTTQEGKNGYRVTGANGCSIFLPTAGFYYEKKLNGADTIGAYWLSSLHSDYPTNAYYLYSIPESVSISSYYRYYGQPVRPVRSL